jgi:hypothetical protein
VGLKVNSYNRSTPFIQRRLAKTDLVFIREDVGQNASLLDAKLFGDER